MFHMEHYYGFIFIMDWNIKTVAHRCAVSGEDFFDGAEIFCFICKLNSGEFARYDVLKKNVDKFFTLGEIIGQWKRTFNFDRERNKSSFQKLAYQEEFFFSLFDGAETEEKEILKQLLALLLERSKILRSERSKYKDIKKYIHIKSHKEFFISQKDFLPEKLTSLENIFEMLA